MTKIKRSENVAQDRAQRVRGLRDALRYSRQKFCDKYAKYGVTPSTLQSWEMVRWNGLTERGAEILATVFREEGLNVTVEWLLFGVGESPLKMASQLKIAHSVAKVWGDETIAQELRFFHQLNQEAVDAVVVDDGFAPWLAPGDRVAGKRFFAEDMEKALGHPCIVQTIAGGVLIRLLKDGSDADGYTLTCANTDTTVAEPVLKNVKLFSAAPILWIRKPGLS